MSTLNSAAGCVLIVEDEAAFRSALAMAIGDEGYRVLCAGNGQEAISLLENAVPDVIILDIHMPIMNGPSFLAEYRRRHRTQAPVIVCSTSRHDSLVSQLNVAASMSKPVDIDELLDAIQTLSKRQRSHEHSIPPVKSGTGKLVDPTSRGHRPNGAI